MAILAVQAGQPRYRTEAISRLEIESDDFVLSHTIKPGLRPEAQTPRLLKLYTMFWNKHPHEMPVSVVIFADGRHRISCTEWMLAGNSFANPMTTNRRTRSGGARFFLRQ